MLALQVFLVVSNNLLLTKHAAKWNLKLSKRLFWIEIFSNLKNKTPALVNFFRFGRDRIDEEGIESEIKTRVATINRKLNLKLNYFLELT